MLHPWIRRYLQLVLRVGRSYDRLDRGPFVDCYYGPADLAAAVEGEPRPMAAELVGQVGALADSLPAQGFERSRADFLGHHLRALETYCHKLDGHAMSLEEEISGCLDVEADWQAEAPFEQSLALLAEALPGNGDLRTRFARFWQQTTIGAGQPEQVRTLMERILGAARERSQRFVHFPPGEELEVATVRAKPYGAANWYLGGYRSRLEVNVDRPVNPIGLLYQMCHEGYPGHHTEFAAKEKSLYLERGIGEQSVFFLGPQLVIAEGIATLAQRIVFSPEELAAWLADDLLAGMPLELDDVDLPKLIRGLDLSRIDELQGNLVIMQREGRSEQELVDYALAYTPHAEARIHSLISNLKSSLPQVYAFSYCRGKSLIEPLLEGPDRHEVFRRLLTEQVTPSLLRNWA